MTPVPGERAGGGRVKVNHGDLSLSSPAFELTAGRDAGDERSMASEPRLT